MLQSIAIENFALIHRLHITFGGGLNLISGETGSGKSILVDAVGLLVGARASQEMIRQGFDCARVEGIFDHRDDPRIAARLNDLGIPDGAGELLVRREISASGANRIYLNDRLATLGALASVGSLLVDIHGQHSQQQLFSTGAHLELLDAFAECGPLRERASHWYRRWRQLEEEQARLRTSEQERLQRLDLLRFQVKEIDALNLRPGLDRELAEERLLLGSAEKRLQAASGILQVLYEDEPAVLTLVDREIRRAEELETWDARCSNWVGRLREARFLLEEIALEARDYAGGIEFDPRRLEAVEERLDELARLQRKYGSTAEDMLRHRDQAAAEIQSLENREAEIVSLDGEVLAARDAYHEVCSELSARRQAAAGVLSGAVERELADLAMGGTVFTISISAQDAPSETGVDAAEFLLSANPGEMPRPLVRIASGGELSRVMLALKSVVKGEAGPGTQVFDEVDAGIGGKAANRLGAKLAALAKRRQVFCVTHLPQLAAFADSHYRAEKSVRDGRTEVQVTRLDESDRVEELARMLAGERISETTLRQARELLARPAAEQS